MADAEPHIDPAPDFDHSHELISSTRVEGTPIVNARGEKLGTLHSLMIHKETGQVAYAILSFGGFLGIGAGKHPVPWKKLRYDPDFGGFLTDITQEQLTGAPSWTRTWFDDPDYHRRSHDHYGVPPNWK